VACPREYVLVIRHRQMRCDEANGRQHDCTIFKRGEDGREAPHRASRLDAVIGGALGEVQRLRAIRKQRGVALAQVEPPHVELHQRTHERCSDPTFTRRETLHGREEFIIGEMCE
jgi:hypothetical protein